MSGFRKAEPAQAFVKMSGYGPPGSGKTFSALLFAEGIAQQVNKRIAYVDTERGTDFYAMPVAAREVHPAAFDFDAIYTRSLTETLQSCKALSPKVHGVIVIDSISHLWETAMNSYTGPRTRAGTVPVHAWTKIKAPYKELMRFLVDSPFHVFIMGRQSIGFEKDDDTGELRSSGLKMRAEGETAYEPHVCLRFSPQKDARTNAQLIAAVTEKDRSGVLSGKVFQPPTFASVIAPLLSIMGYCQAATPSDEEAAAHDAEARDTQAQEFAAESGRLRERYLARFSLAEDVDVLEEIVKELTPSAKKEFSQIDLATVRTAYATRRAQLKGRPVRQQSEEEAA